ncbi:MAG: hypothetical protein JRI66_03285 [Deltaproteobacteria bacterium]|nr:hypothetical protein [Deltaproteobacteria bacterium]
MRLLGAALILLVLAGCSHHRREMPGPEVVETPPRYRIEYRDRGTLVIPGFATVERDGEFVLVPVF